MNIPKPKFNLRKEDILKKIKENPEFYNSRDNAVNTYNLISKNYELIKFESNSEQVIFDKCFDDLKKVILIENKDMFEKQFAVATFNIASCLKKTASFYYQ